ncbi:nuclease-related domain-containing protein [Actinomadura macra]|uniref:nuclease-related domain-containing protein n=1 Tax=Actinomadura macra TaxID=46164 RepID=UPI000A015089|nr:nuclease-related domain-containing protein [Actinomadura macra]
MDDRKPPEPPPTAFPTDPVAPEIDLGLNRPGAAARARAIELRSWRTRTKALFGVRTEARDFAVGAKGERFIGRKIEKWARRQGWHVLHAVPVGRNGADIDHVLIGPFGVVTVNTKTTRGKVWVAENAMMVSGVKVDHLRNSRHEAQRARDLLAIACGHHVPVRPVIVFVGATSWTVRGGGPTDVAVLQDVKALRRWLRRRGRVLTPEQVTAVHAAARRPRTWQRNN